MEIITEQYNLKAETNINNVEAKVKQYNPMVSTNSPKVIACSMKKQSKAESQGRYIYNKDHNELINRDMKDQHPISAITGLEEALKNAGTGSGGSGKVNDVLVDGKSVLDENGNANINGLVKKEVYNEKISELEQTDKLLNESMSELTEAAEQIGEDLENFKKTDDSLNERMENLEEVGEYILKELGNKAGKNEIPDVSEFIKNTVDNLVNYYLKSEVYNKEEINQLANTISSVNIKIVSTLPTTGETNIIYFVSKTGSTNDVYDEWIYINNSWEHIGSTKCDLTGYATEKWVEDKNYMPIPDFREYMEFFYYDKNQVDQKVNDVSNNVYTKKEIDTKLEELPTGTELKATDNAIIEDDTIKVVTNTGYKVIDKDIQMQPINDSGTTGTNKMVYTDDEVTIIYDGTNKIRRSENGIDFEVITLPTTCKVMEYNANSGVLYGTNANNYFVFSEDNGLTWKTTTNSRANGVTQIAIGYGSGFRATYKSSKEIINFAVNLSTNTVSLNSRIGSTIVPEFTAMVNNTQFVWCNSTGTFKYGAGSQEGNFASLTGVTINLLKRVNEITMIGLKNDNRIYLLEPAGSITAYKWIEYTLPDTCTVNDIIFNPYDETYYIFTDINTYYKTKDFVSYDSVDKNDFRGIQGYFTLMGIQMTTIEKNYLLLAPTRTTLENKAQEWDRALNKDRWVGPGLERVGLEQIGVKVSMGVLGVNSNGIYLKQLDENNLSEDIVESIYSAKAELKDNFDPYEMENWYWEFGIPYDDTYQATKFIFNQAGSFYNMATWEEEYVVEPYEYGYVFSDSSGGLFKYVKLGNLAWLFNKGE